MAMDANIADFPKAAEYFRRSSEQGDNDATYALAMLYKEGTGVAKDRQKAVQLLKVAAEEQHISSMVDYAIAVFNGDGVVVTALKLSPSSLDSKRVSDASSLA